MGRRWSPNRYLIVIGIAITLAPLMRLPVSQAGDDIAADNGEMARQREAYQSQYFLVKAVQKRLDVYGYRPGPIDGILGPKTRAALMAFQKDKELKVDGLIGIETLRELNLIRKSN